MWNGGVLVARIVLLQFYKVWSLDIVRLSFLVPVSTAQVKMSVWITKKMLKRKELMLKRANSGKTGHKNNDHHFIKPNFETT